MAKSVAGDLYYELDGQLCEIKRQLRQREGYPFDPLALRVFLQRGIEGNFTMGEPTFNRDMRKEGWRLIENAPRRLTSATDLEAISFLRSGESSVGGEQMLCRARMEFDANYGQEDAEFLLDHQNKVPKEFRSHYLIFPGTVWEGSSSDRRVPYLYWDGERWYLDFHWLGSGFDSDYRFVRPRK